MPILPLDHLEPFTATLGVMLYPDDPVKAQAYAAQLLLAEPIPRFLEAGHSLSQHDLVRIMRDSGLHLADREKRWWGGSAVGEAFKIFLALYNSDRGLASWSNAVTIAEKNVGRRSGSRTALYEAKSRFWEVAHLWGAWSIRNRQFVPSPTVGYDGSTDFQSFLAEAEILREWGQEWQPLRRNSESPSPPYAWRVPEGWEPPAREAGWPKTGIIPYFTIAEELLAELKQAPHAN
jgi:hypothetical protein